MISASKAVDWSKSGLLKVRVYILLAQGSANLSAINFKVHILANADKHLLRKV